jgi:hypothetical protein
MAITYPIDFPSDLSVSSITITPRNAVGRNESPFTFQEQIYDFGGEQWQVEGTLPLMNKATAEKYVSFMLKLKGRYGTFLFPIPLGTAQGAVSGSPVVDGGGQTGAELDLKSLPLSTANVFKAGDWINLGSGSSTRAYKILNDVNSDGAGKATVDIWPSLRSSPADNAAVTYQNCKILLRLKQDDGYSINPDQHYFIQFSALEAL